MTAYGLGLKTFVLGTLEVQVGFNDPKLRRSLNRACIRTAGRERCEGLDLPVVHWAVLSAVFLKACMILKRVYDPYNILGL